MNNPQEILDTIVVGGGPAGLSAALLLGRCRRVAAVFDEGRPRNETSAVVNGFLGVNETSPQELLSCGRAQLARYPNVRFYRERVEDARREDALYHIRLKGGRVFCSRSLIIATGLIDRLPEIEGLEKLYGKSVFPCPYCDGWENSGQRLAALGSGVEAADLALELKIWSPHVALFSSGIATRSALRSSLCRAGVTVYGSPPVKLISAEGRLAAVRCEDAMEVPCDALFWVAGQIQHHDFLERMGCRLSGAQQVESDESGRTPVPGLFVAGNAKKGLQMAMIAAADGIKSAAAANQWLLEQDTESRGL